jgi:hypothetical protein
VVGVNATVATVKSAIAEDWYGAKLASDSTTTQETNSPLSLIGDAVRESKGSSD